MIDMLDKLIQFFVDAADREGERDTAHRLRRARASLHAPIDTDADDDARRAELERVLRGGQ